MTERPRTGALSLGPRMILEQLRSQPAVVVTILVASALGVFLLGAAPRSLETAATDDLRAVVEDSPPAMRNIRVEWRSQINAGPEDDPLAIVRQVGEAIEDRQFPASVSAVISDRYPVVDTGRFRVLPLPGEAPPHPFDTYLRFRFQGGIGEHIRLTSGAEPSQRDPIEVLIGRDCPNDPGEIEDLTRRLAAEEAPDDEDLECGLEEVPHFEIVVSEATRLAMGLEIGETMLLSPDRIDPFYFGLDSRALDFRLAVSISGVIELDDPVDEYWFGDRSLHTPRIQENADLRIIYATGLASASDFGPMIRAIGHIANRHTWRYVVSADLMASSDPDVLESDLESLQAEFPGAGARLDQPAVISQLNDLLADHQEQRRRSIIILSTGAAGLLSMVIGVLVVLTLLMTERQRGAIALMRARGSSGGQLGLTRLYEALLVIVPASVLGYAAAYAAYPDTEGLASYRLTVGVAALGSAAMVAATLPVARAHLGALIRRRARRPPRPGGRRLVLEVSAIALAAGAIAISRRRGQTVAAGRELGVDVLLAIAPVLVAVAIGLATLRLMPALARIASSFSKRSRGLVSLVGVRRVLQQSMSERLPALVIVLCLATASLALLSQTTITRGQNAAAWQSVGADYSIRNFGDNAPLPSAIGLDDYEVVESFALGARFNNARVASGLVSTQANVLAIASTAYVDVAEESPVEPGFPDGFAPAPTSGVGTPDEPMPAIVSSNWPSGLDPSVGDILTLGLGRAEPAVRVAQVRDSYPDMPDVNPFVIIDLDALRSFSDLPVQPTVAYVRAAEDAAPALRQALASDSSLATATSRYETLRAVTGDPLVSWVVRVLGLVSVAALVLAGVTAVSALALGSAQRSRDFAFIRTMGLRRRQALAMTLVEHFPPLLVAGLIGLLAGLGTGLMLGPAVDFTPFTGGATPASIQFDPVALALGSLALVSALGATVVIFVVTFREEELSAALRLGDET